MMMMMMTKMMMMMMMMMTLNCVVADLKRTSVPEYLVIHGPLIQLKGVDGCQCMPDMFDVETESVIKIFKKKIKKKKKLKEEENEILTTQLIPPVCSDLYCF